MVLNSIPTDWLQILETEIAKPDENLSIKLFPDTKPKLVIQLTCRWLYTALLLDEARATDHRTVTFLSFQYMSKVCGKHEESLTHLFFLCPSVKNIWKYITTLIRQ